MVSALDWITGIGQTISGVAAPIVSWFTNKKTNDTNKENVESTNQANKDIATQTNDTNQAIAAENLNYQRELQEYNKALQKQIFDREDTSYQRTKNDMLAAGLNPLSMQGTNGSGEVISQSPLHNEFQSQQPAPMQAPVAQESNLATTMLSAAKDLFTSIQDLQTGTISRDKLRSEAKWNEVNNILNSLGKGITVDSNGKIIIDDAEVDAYASSQRKKIEAEKSQAEEILRENLHKVSANLYDTDTKVERALTALTDWLTSDRSEQMWNKLKQKYPMLQLLDMYAKQLFGKESLPDVGTDYDYYEDIRLASSNKKTRRVYKNGKVIKEYELLK